MAVKYKGREKFRIECGRFAERYPDHEAARLLAEGDAIIEELEAELEEVKAAKPAQGEAVAEVKLAADGHVWIDWDVDSLREMIGTKLYTHPAERAGVPTEMPVEFGEWFGKNYSGPDTIISNPHWHAPRIWRAARRAMLAAAPQAPADGEEVGRG